MIRLLVHFVLGLTVIICMGCEDKIDLIFPAVPPKVVIVGEIVNRQQSQEVHIYYSHPIQATDSVQPVNDAKVRVTDQFGRSWDYRQEKDGVYRSSVFRGMVGATYTLQVQIGELTFSAISKMPAPVPIDSIGISIGTFFNKQNKFITMKFLDPPGERNFYQYFISLNGTTWKHMQVFQDLYNDGKYVTHELLNFDLELESSDYVRIRRRMIDAANYQYWASYAATHPSAASPSNPISNISGDALGYFSAYSLLEYELTIP